MQKLLLLSLYLLMAIPAFTQVSDFLSVRRKNGRSIKTYYAGSDISFKTKTGIPVSGSILHMRHDTLFLFTYNTRVVPTSLGVTMVDTFSRRIERISYKDIGQIQVFSKQRGIYQRVGKLLQIGGGGFIFLNVFNGLTLGGDITGKENMRRIKTAALVGVGGTIVSLVNRDNQWTRKRHRIIYIPLQ